MTPRFPPFADCICILSTVDVIAAETVDEPRGDEDVRSVSFNKIPR